MNVFRHEHECDEFKPELFIGRIQVPSQLLTPIVVRQQWLAPIGGKRELMPMAGSWICRIVFRWGIADFRLMIRQFSSSQSTGRASGTQVSPVPPCRHRKPIYFAIRKCDSLIGHIGFDGLTMGHKAEIGY